jgi:hypothetical protein
MDWFMVKLEPPWSFPVSWGYCTSIAGWMTSRNDLGIKKTISGAMGSMVNDNG